MLYQMERRAWLLPMIVALILPVASMACTGEQSFVVTLKMFFTQDRDPSIPPAEDARVPLVVGVSHTSEYHLFEKTTKVDDSAAEVASALRSDKIAQRLDELRDQGVVSSYVILEDVPIADVSQMELKVVDDASLISIMAPIAPSPAWFVGVDSYRVCRDGKFVLKDNEIDVDIYDSGLDDGKSFTGDKAPRKPKEAKPVEKEFNFKSIASLSLEQGTLGVNWWKILLGVLVAVAVVIVVIIFVYPRCRKKRRAEIPLTAQEEIDW